MPNLDDELRRRLQRAGRRIPTAGVYERLSKRRDRRALTHRVGSGALAVAVVAGSSLGLLGLQRAFRGSGDTPIVARNGGTSTTVGFVRAFNGQCDGPGHEGGFEIFTVDTITGEERQIPFHTQSGSWQEAVGPDFSPDGSEVAYIDVGNHHLDVTDVATGATRTLVSGLQVIDAVHWSADGSSILFYSLDAASDGYSIYVVRADGTGLTRLAEGQIPVWTDQGQIAFMNPTEGGTGFFTMDADGTHLQLRYERSRIVPISDPSWSPDGNEVAAAALLHGNRDIFVVDLTLGTARNLTGAPGDFDGALAVDSSPSWSPDGSQIAFSTGRWSATSYRVNMTIGVMNAGGTDIRQLTNTCWNDYFATWVKNDSVVKTLPVWDPKN
jgi:Tol biopolymer transport system component